MGHEFCGTVAASNGSPSFRTGDRVISNSIIACGGCRACRRGDMHLCSARMVFGMHRPGAFAEYVAVPAAGLIPWPEGLPARAACLAEPLANGIHVAHLLAHHTLERILIFGAGPIGLMCQQAVQVLLGARTIVADRLAARLEVAARLGATTVNATTQNLPDVVAGLTAGEGVDAVVDAVGSAVTKSQSLRLTRPGGAVVWIGLHEDPVTIDSYQVTLPERTIHGSYAATTAELRQATAMMASGQVDVESWVHAFPLADGATAFHRMLAAQGDDIKAVLLP